MKKTHYYFTSGVPFLRVSGTGLREYQSYVGFYVAHKFNMLPLKKRPYRGSSFSTAKRLKKMECQIYRNRPEMKSATVGSSGTIANSTQILLQPCRVASGTGVNERTGDKIRVWRIEVRGIADPNLDSYIIQCKTTTQPTVGLFGTLSGAYLLDSENTNRFTEWRHYSNLNYQNSAPGSMKFSHRFKGGIVVKFNGTAGTSVVDNEIVAYILNRSGVSAHHNLSCRMWYTDA